MRTVLLLVFVVLFGSAAEAAAQTPVIIGPNTLLVWDLPGLSQATAQGCSETVQVNGGAAQAVVGTPACVTAVPPAPAGSTCSINLTAQTEIPIGSNTLTMQVTCSGVTSLPSTPFAYVDIIIPVPTNIRIK